MSISEYIDNMFTPLSEYLINIKTVLYELETTNNPEQQNSLQINIKPMLQTIKTKLDLYKTDVDSTIEHVDQILATSTSTGGKKRKSKKRKTRKKW
jgi:hypothetical protein